jgi:hypothetical protein
MTWDYQWQPRDEDYLRRALAFLDETFEAGFMRRAEEALVDAKRLDCGFTVTHSHGGFATAQIVADPEVPKGKANVHYREKTEGVIRSWRPGQPKW